MPLTTQGVVPPPPLSTGARAVLLLLAAGLVFLLLAACMARVVTYDEDQYLAAGLMVAQGKLPYRDFVYLQAPLYPFVLGAVFKVAGGYYLLAGRLLTFVLAVVSAAVLWRLLRRLGAGHTLAAVLLAACLASPFLASPWSNTRNDALPLCLFLLGLWCKLAAGDREDRGGFVLRFAAALLLGLAAEAKVSYVFGPAVLLVHACFAPRRRLLPAVLGVAVAAVPAVLLLGAAGLEPMRFGLLDFHLTASPDWYRQQGLDAQLEAPVRLQMLLGWLVLGGNLTLLALSVTLMLLTVARKRNWKRPGQLLVALLAGAAVADFLPSPSWAMYFAVVAPLLACCIAHLDRITTHLADPARKRVLVLVSALPVVPVLLLLGPDVARFVRGDWAGLGAHRTAVAVRAALPGGGPVATLFPHLVMDANPLLVPFVSGPFVFRSGGLYSPELLGRLHAASPGTLEAVLGREKPAGIFAGAYGTAFRAPMDAALTEYAEARGWRLVLTDPGGGRLWIDPAYGAGRPDVIPRAPN